MSLPDSISTVLGVLGIGVQHESGNPIASVNDGLQVAALVAANGAAVSPEAAAQASAVAIAALSVAIQKYQYDQAAGVLDFKTVFDDSATIIGDTLILSGAQLAVNPLTKAFGEATLLAGDAFTVGVLAIDAETVAVGNVPGDTIEQKASTIYSTIDAAFQGAEGVASDAVSSAISQLGQDIEGSIQVLSGAGNAGAINSSEVDRIISDTNDVNAPILDIYKDNGFSSLSLQESNSDGVVNIQGGVTPTIESGTPSGYASDYTISSDIENSNGTSAKSLIESDGSSTTITYNGADGTGTPTGIDQENADGTSDITTYYPGGSSTTVAFSGPGGTGAPGSLTLSNAGVFSPGDTTDVPLTVTLDASNVVFPATRVPFPGTAYNHPAPLLGIPVTVTSGAFADIYSVASADGAFALQQIGFSGDYGVGTYPVGTPGSLVVAEQTDQSGNFADSLPVTVSAGSVALSGTISASGVVYAPAVASYDESLDFGHIHVGDTPSMTIAYSNTASGAYADNLEVGGITQSYPSSAFNVVQNGTLNLAPGQTGDLTVTLSALKPGLRANAGTNVSLVSHDAAQADVPLPSYLYSLGVVADIYAYAAAAVTTSGEAAQVTHSGNTYVVDLGALEQESYQTGVDILIGNTTPSSPDTFGATDYLDGSYTTSGSGFNAYDLSGDETFNTVTSSGSEYLLDAVPDTSMPGAHTETMTILPTSDDSFSSTVLPTLTVEVIDNVACYCLGTLIQTASGEVLVEHLAIGDIMVTASGQHRPIRWIGRRSYAGRFLAANPGVQPIRFRAGSLGGGLPRRDLSVSPEHAMFLDGLLVPARLLANESTIAQESRLERVDYFHVELDSHDVLLAEGAPSESFLDDNSRGMFHNASEFARLYPKASGYGRFCAPRVTDGYELEAVRQRLADAAGKEARAA